MQRNRRWGGKTYPDGDGCGGVCEEDDWEDDEEHGCGRISYDDGAVYDGNSKGGKRHGWGKMTYADGDMYEGDWNDDMRNGKGNYTLSYGGVYEGCLMTFMCPRGGHNT